jgi:hypothetical protein
VGLDEDRDMSLLKGDPIHHCLHVEVPSVAVERCYDSQAVLKSDLGTVHLQVASQQLQVAAWLAAWPYSRLYRPSESKRMRVLIIKISVKLGWIIVYI